MTIKDVTLGLFDRYKLLIENQAVEEGDETSLNHLKWMCEHCMETDMPIDKLSRWLGFVQGVLAAKKLISVKEERDFSRPWFHAAYNANQTSIPMTIDRDTTKEEVDIHLKNNGRIVVKTEDMPEWMFEEIMNSMNEYIGEEK